MLVALRITFYSAFGLFLSLGIISCSGKTNHPEKLSGMIPVPAASTDTLPKDFQVYSLPSSNKMTVIYNSVEEGKGLISVFFADGKLLIREQVYVTRGLNNWEYQVTDDKKGILFIRFVINNKQRSAKLVRQ